MMNLNQQSHNVEDAMNASRSSTYRYSQVVMGPQGTAVAVPKYLPSLTESMKEILEQMIKGSSKEYETLEQGRMVAAAVMDIFMSTHVAFKFLESYNARSTLYM